MKAIEGFYKKGKTKNIWAYWHENGKKWKEETFKDGKKDGKWILYGENREYGREDSYKDGELIDEDDINWLQECEL